MVENAENTCPEVEKLFICFCAQNMSFTSQLLTEGCLISLSDLDLTIEEAGVLLVPHAIYAI